MTDTISKKEIWQATVLMTSAALGGVMANPQYRSSDISREMIRDIAQASMDTLVEISNVVGLKPDDD